MTNEQESVRGRYHHGDLRKALVQAALAILTEHGLGGFAIAEVARIVGVSAAAPYRHFRDRDALLAEVARRGFEALTTELMAFTNGWKGDPCRALERAAQAHLSFPKGEAAISATMFETEVSATKHPVLAQVRDQAFSILRRVANAACAAGQAPRRPPPLMVSLHVWSLTHGIATLFLGRPEDGSRSIPTSPEALLEAGLLIHLQSLGLRGA